MRRVLMMAGVAALTFAGIASTAYAKELAHSDKIQSDADKIGVTNYMSCQAFRDLIRADAERANMSHSLESNRVLERHTAQMMVLLQPYAVTGPDGRPLDFVWGYLVNTLGDWCSAHPQAPLEDGIHHAGLAMVDAIKHAREQGLKDQSVVETPSAPEEPSLPPASLFSPTIPGPDTN